MIYKKYFLKDLFEIGRGDIFNQGKLIEDKKSDIMFVAQNDNNNGFVKNILPENYRLFNPNIIIGRQTGVIYYQPKKFVTTDGVLVLNFLEKIFTKNEGLFFVSSIKKQLFKFGYTNTVSAEKLKKEEILLPTINGEIDFEFMETFIKAIEKLVIKDLVIWNERKLEAYKEVIAK